MARSSFLLASLFGGFLVHAVFLACGAPLPRVSPVAAQSPAPSVAARGTAAVPEVVRVDRSVPPETTATFAVSGDEKMTFDPLDAEVTLDATYGRGPGGRRVVRLVGVARLYRTDVRSERPTTLAVRATFDAAATPQGGPSEVEAYLTTWGATASPPPTAPRSYAAVLKSNLTSAVTQERIELRGSLALRDGATGRSVTIDHLAFTRAGTALLAARGTFHVP